MLFTIVRKSCKEEMLGELGELSQGLMPILGKSVSGRDKSMYKGPEQVGNSLVGFEYQEGAGVAEWREEESDPRGPRDGKVTGRWGHHLMDDVEGSPTIVGSLGQSRESN